jgi:ammonia channel protein AmtB
MVDVLNVHLIVGIVLVLFTAVIKKPQTEDAEMAWRRISTQFIAVS